MDFENVIVDALGMQDVDIESFEYDLEKLEAHFTVRQIRVKAVCHSCNEKLYGVKQWKKRKLKGAPLGVFLKVSITFYHLQGGCGRCQKNRLAEAPYIHPAFKKMTCAFAETAGRLM